MLFGMCRVESSTMSAFKSFWYVAIESSVLRTRPLRSVILGEDLVLWRDEQGTPVAFPDRCLHRCARLSSGRVDSGLLQCRYHGWTYDSQGQVCSIPAEGGPPAGGRELRVIRLETREQDGYVYVRLEQPDAACGDAQPFAMPHWNEGGWGHVRLVNDFQADVADCVENYIDIPHTAFVHDRIFRVTRGERITAVVTRSGGRVRIRYSGERNNLGSWRWFLNPSGGPVEHEDNFFMPNVTSVNYRLPNGYEFVITSQSVPSDARKTRVYTDLSYRFGLFTRLAKPFVRRAGQVVIDQDVDILAEQGEVVARHGRKYQFSTPDRIHRCVDDIREAISRGEDARTLPEQLFEFEFFV